jgi:hypothetical protein
MGRREGRGDPEGQEGPAVRVGSAVDRHQSEFRVQRILGRREDRSCGVADTSTTKTGGCARDSRLGVSRPAVVARDNTIA